jgi:hypothetical protein
VAPWVVAVAAVAIGVPRAGAEPRPVPRPVPPAAVCGEAELVGAPLTAQVGEGGCGVAAPVRLEAAAGVALEPPATVACETARALLAWIEGGAKPAFAAEGRSLAAVTVLDDYSCRGVNRDPEAELSEHAYGRAIDIGGFRLGDGATVAVREAWSASEWGPALRRVHAAGCGVFGTVLGPDANPLHADHLHLDTEARRSGPYCR